MPERVGGSGRAWLDWVRASAFRKLFLAAIALGVPGVCGLALAGYLTAERVIQQSVLSELAVRAELAAGEVELTVGAVMNGARALAQNPIVIGSLTDAGAVEPHLVPLLRDFASVSPSPVHLVVIDRQGRTIGCSLHVRQSSFLGAPWLPTVTGRGEIHVDVAAGAEGPVLLYAQPVVPQEGGPALGGFVAEIALTPLLQEFSEGREHMILSLHATSEPAVPSGEETVDAAFLVAERPLALGSEGGIRLRISMPHDVAFRGLHRFGAVAGAGLVATLLLIVGGVWLLAARLTRGVRELSASVVEATLTDRRGVRVPSTEGDEVGALGAAFNVLLARLEEASEARLAEQIHRTEGAEHALRLAWRAMEQAVEAIEVVRADGMVVFSNGSAARLRAAAGTGVARQRWEALFGRKEEWWHATWARLKAERALELALRVPQRGESVPVAAGLVFFEMDGEEHAIATVRDERERIRAEATERLASLGTLAAGVAHEINNPLAYVLGNLSFVKESLEGPGAAGLGEEERRALAEAIQGAERVRDVVRSLRAYSRPGEGPPVLVDVAQELAGALKLVGNTLRHKARLVERLDRTPPVLARSTELGQVFVNLLVNAAQAVRPGAGDEAEVVARCYTTPEGRAAVEISDNGVGIPQEVQDRIFEPFFTTKGVGDGTGLGLSICHGIVTRLGGSIGFESEPGHGTRFTVLLPSAPSATGVAPPAEAPPPRGRILVIDDDAAVTRALARTLGRTAEVSIETDAEAALARIAGAPPPDAILCDVMMPGLSGPAFYERLCALDPELARRVVFITGGTVTEAIARAVAATGRPCVDKPPEREALARAIAAVQG